MSSTSVFRDSQTSQLLPSSTQSNKKKLTILIGLSVVLLLIAIAMTVLFIIWSNKLKISKDQNKHLEETITYFDAKVISLSDENKELIQQLSDLNNQIIVSNIHKHLNFTDLNMTGISIKTQTYYNKPRESQIQVLNLTSNAFEVFEGNSIQTLQTLILDENPLVSFLNNNFQNMKKLNFSKIPTLLKFEGNFFHNLDELIFANPFALTSVSNNHLDKSNLTLNFLFDNNSPMLAFNGNVLQVSILKFKRQKLASFSSNDLRALQQLIIQPLSQDQFNVNNNSLVFSYNKFQKIKTLSFQNQNLMMEDNYFKLLQTLTINSCNSVILQENMFKPSRDFTHIEISNISEKLIFQNNYNVESLKINLNNNISLLIDDDYILILQLTSKVPITIDFYGNSFWRLNNLSFSKNIKFNKFSLNQFFNIIQLNLQNKYISEFKDNYLGIITTINLSQNNLTEFNNYKSNDLTYLDLLMNPLTQIINNEFQKLETFRLGNYIGKSRIVNFSNNYLPLANGELYVSKASGVFNNNTFNSITEFKIGDAENLTSFNDNNFDSIQSFTIYSANISSIDNLKTYTKLKILDLRNCKFTSFDELPYLTQLVLLNLNYNLLTSFNNYQHQKLQKLYIRDMDISTIMNNKLDSLIQINLQNPNVALDKIFNNSFASFKDDFNFASCNMTQFSNNSLPQIQNLKLYWNQISQFIGNNLSNIQYLSLFSNKISSIKENTINPNIKTIDISNNVFNSFDDNKYQKLYELQIRSNLLQSFENNTFQSLERLYLSNNKLSQIRHNLMPNINKLDLSKNQFTANIVQQIVALNLKNLQSLILTENQNISIQEQPNIEAKIKETAPNVQITW